LGLGEYEQQAVTMFKQVHLSVENASKSFFDMLRRKNYVTPTSYLELLSSFGKLIGKFIINYYVFYNLTYVKYESLYGCFIIFLFFKIRC